MLEADSVFEPGQRVILSAAKGTERQTEIQSFRRQHGRCVAKFRGIDAISEAEQYVGSEIRIPTESLPAVKEGWFYTFQLRGSEVFAVDGEFLGTVSDVADSGGAQVLSVKRENAETLIPFAHSYIRKVDIGQRRIEVDLPEELRTLNKEQGKKQRRKSRRV
jgi:16S rRNA processing protein RimM